MREQSPDDLGREQFAAEPGLDVVSSDPDADRDAR